MDLSLHRGTGLYVCSDTLRHNYRSVEKLTQKQVIGVVKGRAYGTSMLSLTDALYSEGCRFFAVATVDEGIALRKHLSSHLGDAGQSTILIFGYCPHDAIFLAREHSLSLSLFDIGTAKRYQDSLSQYRAADPPPSDRPPVSVHLVVDSGMTRVGFFPHQVTEAIHVFQTQLGELSLEGLFTHFARADEPRVEGAEGYKFTMEQWEAFQDVVSRVQRIPTSIKFYHAANSGAILQYPETYTPDWITHVRPGSLLHGVLADLLWYNPALSASSRIVHKDEFRQATSWRTMLASVRRMPFSRPVGYGGRYIAEKGEWIGTLPVGYADGLRRISWDNPAGPNLVRITAGDVTEIFPVVGVVAMDFCMITFAKHIKWSTSLDNTIEINVVPFKGMEEFVTEVRSNGTENARVELMSAASNSDPLSAFQIAKRWGTIELEVRSGIRNRNSYTVESLETSRMSRRTRNSFALTPTPAMFSKSRL